MRLVIPHRWTAVAALLTLLAAAIGAWYVAQSGFIFVSLLAMLDTARHP